ncbi:unnamed protein product [Caenorhabditis bovis]|uniref:Uncharacterized protein n=1 Tax=Caenorhabditis bovis TaxID=2654633 RepID=A0A8S1EHG3_9PELO|nr:unnamed protein product [Caenorhabditis bovis]
MMSQETIDWAKEMENEYTCGPPQIVTTRSLNSVEEEDFDEYGNVIEIDQCKGPENAENCGNSKIDDIKIENEKEEDGKLDGLNVNQLEKEHEEIAKTGELLSIGISTSARSHHPWHQYYNAKPAVLEDLDTADKILKNYNIEMVEEFQNMHNTEDPLIPTIQNSWISRYYPNRKGKEIIPSTKLPDCYALYVVVKETPQWYFMRPTHFEVFAPERDDLFMIRLEKKNYKRMYNNSSWIRLYLGDVVVVHTMSNSPMSDEYQTVWKVHFFTILPREICNNVLVFVTGFWYSDDVSKSYLIGNKVSGIIRTRDNMFKQPSLHKMFKGDVFVPNSSHFLFCANIASPERYHKLCGEFNNASRVISHPPPTLASYRVCRFEPEFISNAPRAFQVYPEPTAFSCVGKTLLLVSNGIEGFLSKKKNVAYISGKLDIIDDDSKNIIRIMITADCDSSRQLNDVKMIHIVTPIGRFDARLLSVECTTIHGIVLRNELSNLAFYKKYCQAVYVQAIDNFKNVIVQLHNMNDVSRWPLDCVARATVKALFGGKTLFKETRPMNISTLIALMNSFKYPAAVIAKEGLTAFDTRVLHFRIVSQLKLSKCGHFIITYKEEEITNLLNVGVSFNPDLHILRIISREDYLYKSKDERTEYDLPFLMDKVIKEKAIDMDMECLRQEKNGTNEMSEATYRDLFHAVKYCGRYVKKFKPRSKVGRELYKKPVDFPASKYLEIFLKTYKPTAIIGSVKDIVSVLAMEYNYTPIGPYTVQIDDGLDIHMRDFMALLAVLPDARVSIYGISRGTPRPSSRLMNEFVYTHAIGDLYTMVVENKLMPKLRVFAEPTNSNDK